MDINKKMTVYAMDNRGKILSIAERFVISLSTLYIQSIIM